MEVGANKSKHSANKIGFEYLIKYRKTGEPISIEVEMFRAFKDKDKLPTASDVLGIYKWVKKDKYIGTLIVF